MKLQNKLALYNTISKILIVLGFVALLPGIINRVAVHHIDNHLLAKKEKMMLIIKRGDIREIIDDEDCSFGNFNLLKEEFVTITPIDELNDTILIANGSRDVGGEIFEFRILSTTFRYSNQAYQIEMGEGLNRIKELNKTLQNITLIVMLIVTLITFLVDVGFSQILLLPLKKIIREKLRNIKHPSEFDFSRINTSTDDFKQLDLSINQMMHKVQEAFNTEKEFIANVSHELLTPISILQNRFENIIGEGKLSQDVEMKMNESLKTLARLGKIIKTLLMISKIENDQYLREDKIKLKEFTEEVWDEIKDRASEKEISFSSHWMSDYELSRCNRTLMFTLIFNLINNSIKYNKINGTIRVEGKMKNDRFMLEIIDSGIGIDQKNIPELFNRFKRFKIRDNESYGLGLPIVKTIADFHNIKIDIESKEGKGTIVRLLFA